MYDRSEISRDKSNTDAVSKKGVDSGNQPIHFIDNRPASLLQKKLNNGITIQGKNLVECIQKVDSKYNSLLIEAAEYAKSQKGEFDSNYENYLKENSYPFEDDECDRPDNETGQFKKASTKKVKQPAIIQKLLQLARKPNTISGPKSYGGLKNILYQLDNKGNIDFSNPQQYFIGNAYSGIDPVEAGSQVDISSSVGTYGTDNRYQHFKEANTLKPKFGGTYGNSPDGLTWHHLTSKYYMHLVNRQVHRKHGHNGGVHIW